MKTIKYIYINRKSWNCTQIFNDIEEYNAIMKVNMLYHNCVTNGNITTVYIGE